MSSEFLHFIKNKTTTTAFPTSGIIADGLYFLNSKETLLDNSESNVFQIRMGQDTTTLRLLRADLLPTRNINGINFDGSTDVTNYGTCNTAAATAAKVVSDIPNFELSVGASVYIKFANTNTATNPTLNVNGTGAVAIVYNGDNIKAGYLLQNRILHFIYNGSQWEYVGYIDTNNYAYVRQYATDTDTDYPLLFRYDTAEPTGTSTYVTKYSRYDANLKIYANPYTGTIGATRFAGTADCADELTKPYLGDNESIQILSDDNRTITHVNSVSKLENYTTSANNTSIDVASDGGSFKVRDFTYDDYGHINGSKAVTINLKTNKADGSKWGIVKGWHHTTGEASGTHTTSASNAPAIVDRTTEADRYYGVETDAKGYLFVNVPWKNSTYTVGNATITLSPGTGLAGGGSFTTNQTGAGEIIYSLATVGTAGTYGPTANVTGSNGNTIKIPQIVVDEYGRVTSVTERTYTSKDTTYSIYNSTISFSAGDGIELGDTKSFGLNQDSGATITVSHGDTSSVEDLSASTRTYINSLTFDEFGHVTGYGTGEETVTDTNYYHTPLYTTGGRQIATGTGVNNMYVPSATDKAEGVTVVYPAASCDYDLDSGAVTPAAVKKAVGLFETTYSTATDSTLGLVKIGYSSSGKNYAVQLDDNDKMYVNVPWSNTTYSVVTSSANGLVPMFNSADGTIDSSSTDWVLTSNNGSIGWYKLPANAFKNDNTTYTADGTYITLSSNKFSLAKTGITIAGTTVNLGDSIEKTDLLSSLGLTKALVFVGTSSTAIEDGQNSTATINGTAHDPEAGDVVFYENQEFVWNGSVWEVFGNEGHYKVLQTKVETPDADGDATAFITSITQDENGDITEITKCNVLFPELSGGITAANDAKVIGGISVSGHTVTPTQKTIKGSGSVSVSGTSNEITITGTDTTYSAATASTLGLVKVSSVNTSAVSVNAETTTAGRYYPVEMNKDNKLIVNVPWVDTNTTYSAASDQNLGLVKIGDNISVDSNGTISIDKDNVTDALDYIPTPPTEAIPYIEGSTSDTAGAWTGTYAGIDEYTNGLTIIYVPKVAGVDNESGYDTTLNINSLGAKPCYFTNSTQLTTHFSVGTPILFTYVDDCWKRADYNSDTNTKIRVYRQTSGYNKDYPILVSRTETSSIGSDGSNGTYTAVYGVIGQNGTYTPTINPHTGVIKAPGGLEGAATSLSSTDIGSSTQPVYFGSDGKPAVCTAYSGLLTSFSSSTNTLSLTIGGTTKTATIINSLSNTWTAGTTAGPKISTTVNGVTGASVAIPSASSSASGVVTTGAQTFAGDKTLTGKLYLGASTQSGMTNNTGIHVHDLRSTNITPDTFGDKSVNFVFSNSLGTDDWRSAIHIKGWTGSYAAWELSGGATTAASNKLYYREGVGSDWGTWYSIPFENRDNTFTGTFNGMIKISNDESVTTGTSEGKRNALVIYGTTYGNDSTYITTSGKLSYGDPGPQIIFGTNNTITSSQKIALIYTDHDTIATGNSLSLVSTETDASFIAPTIKATTKFMGNVFYAPTTSGGTTYGAGSNGQVLKSDGDTIYWGTDNDTKVIQSRSTTSSWRPVLSHYTYADYGTDPGTATNQTYYHEAIAIQPSTGTLKATAVYGAVWNDYAEFRNQTEEVEPGYCVISSPNGKVSKTTSRLCPCDGIVSDTFGFAIGETNDCKTPLATSGRVLAYPQEDISEYTIGDAVCAGADGKVSKMTREEIREWPDRIVGTVSEFPEYDTWGTGNVKVNGRIWIKVR